MYQSDAIRQKLVAFAYSVQAGRQQGGQGCWRPAQLPTTTSGDLKYEAKMGEQHREIKWSGCREPCSFQSPRGWIFSQRLSVIGELLERGEVLGRRQLEARTHTDRRTITLPQIWIKTTSTQTGIKTTYMQTHTYNPCPQGMHFKTAKSIWRQLSQMLRLQHYIA